MVLKVSYSLTAPKLRLATAEALVQAHVRSSGICGGQSDIEADFPLVLLFPLPIFIQPIAPHLPSRAGTKGQIMADVPSGLSPTAPQETETKLQFMSRSHVLHILVFSSCPRSLDILYFLKLR
jgi:hypothetical protein